MLGLEIEDRRRGPLPFVRDQAPGAVLRVAGIKDSYFLLAWHRGGLCLIDLSDGAVMAGDPGNMRCRVVPARLVLGDCAG